jgi:hypothetical protein
MRKESAFFLRVTEEKEEEEVSSSWFSYKK